MYASIRMYQSDPDKVDEAMHRVDEYFVPTLSEQDWFVAYHCCDCGGGDICSVTICSDEAGVNQSDELAAEFVRERLSDIEITRTDMKSGDVKVSSAAQEVLEPTHA
jgi:hypothetical protein